MAKSIIGKMNYRATFADGSVITRKSEREYNAAWRLVYRLSDTGEHVTKTGFARTPDLAKKIPSREGPARYDRNKHRWVSEPERTVSFEVVATEYLG